MTRSEFAEWLDRRREFDLAWARALIETGVKGKPFLVGLRIIDLRTLRKSVENGGF